MKVTAKAPEITNIEPGVYPAVLAKAEYLDASKTKFGNAQFKFVFTVEDVLTSEGGPVQLNFWGQRKIDAEVKALVRR